MKAVGYREAGAIDRSDALIDLELPMPQPGPYDLRVRVAAVSVNPVDTKIRKNRAPQPGGIEILGWDAVGIVDAVGSAAKGFVVGDRVYYAGDINRSGSNAEYQLVDARIVGYAPALLNDAEVVALPLTAITAWEILFDRLGVAEQGGAGQTLLVTGAAGGVGSILIQLARILTKLTVIGTASRPETQAWVKEMGAHHVINHHQPLAPQLNDLGIADLNFIASLTHTEQHWLDLVALAAPYGHIALIDDPDTPLDLMPLKRKSLAVHWEFMFTSSLFKIAEMPKQGLLLNRVAELVDQGLLKSTLTETLHPINAANLKKAHAQLESGRTKGKVVLTGF